MQLSLQVQTLEHPADDRETLFDFLVGMVESGAERRRAPPVVVVARGRTLELFAVKPLVDAKVHAQRFLAALTRSQVDEGPPPDAVGLMGTFAVRPDREGGPRVPIAQAFVEWPDNAWMHWRTLLDADHAPLASSASRWGAQWGDPLPPQLGRWWSAGRRHQLGLQLQRRPLAQPPLASTMVH